MKNQKEVQIGGYTFTIEYNNLETPVEDINKINCGSLIWVALKPKNQLTEYQGIEIFESVEKNLLKVIKNIVEENIEFYKNFNINYKFNRRSSDLYREYGHIYIISMKVFLEISMKN